MKRKAIGVMLIAATLLMLSLTHGIDVQADAVKEFTPKAVSLRRESKTAGSYELIDIVATKDKTIYKPGDYLATNDITVMGVYRNVATKEEITVSMDTEIDVSEIDMDTAGTKYIEVWCWNDTYEDGYSYLETIEITVIGAAIVTPPPTATPDISIQESDVDNITCGVKYTTVKSGEKYKSAVKVSWKQCDDAYKYEVHRAEGKNNGYKKIAVCDVAASAFTDKTVVKGITYYYRVRAFGGTPTNSYTGKFSSAKSITVSQDLLKPVIKCKRSGKKVVITLDKAEGDKFQLQFRFLKTKKWNTIGNWQKIKKKINLTYSSNKACQMRLRTTMTVNGKKVYSKWSLVRTLK